jgi:two-component system OmpR family response regulator
MLQQSIAEYLETLKHKVICFNNGLSARDSLSTNNYDFMILDINVPNLTGLEFCKFLVEKQINTPRIFISALIDIENISCAFDLGAVDYLKKPFHLKELSIRIDKIKNEINTKYINHIILSDNYTYNKEKQELYYDNKLEILTKKQLDIIDFLCKNINSITSFETLRIYVWDNADVSDATIRSEISRLRKSLKQDFIINHKGLGYKINRYSLKL